MVVSLDKDTVAKASKRHRSRIEAIVIAGGHFVVCWLRGLFTGSQLAMGMGVAGLTTGIVGYTVGKKHGKVQNKKGR